MNRKLIGFIIVLAASALMLGIMLDWSDMTLRHLGRDGKKQVFTVMVLGIFALYLIMGTGFGGGPKPPRRS